jgi:hypothetical protein
MQCAIVDAYDDDSHISSRLFKDLSIPDRLLFSQLLAFGFGWIFSEIPSLLTCIASFVAAVAEKQDLCLLFHVDCDCL